MRVLGSIALLLLPSAVSAQRPPTERLLTFPDVAFTVGYRSPSASVFHSMIRNSAARFEVSQSGPETQQAGRDRAAAAGTDRNPGAAPAGANKDLAGPDIPPREVSPTHTAPEPATLLLLGSGLAIVAAATLRRRRAKPPVR